ncbi:uncharacterized protein [Pseudorasbora parva]|uniref:uncharacterized protein isoform X2 n=1 Tax=Pseudorasbora parva TaxID=51549 RepID=UPI00351F7963
MAFIKEEIEDKRIEETLFSVKDEESEKQTEMEFIKEESENLETEETFRMKQEDPETQTDAKPGTEQTCKARGQTKKDCYICRKKIGVASKTCQHCSAKQPYKQKLEKKKKQLSQEWKDRQKKNSSVNKVYDATHLLLHKWQLLERYPVLLLARRTSSGFSAECLCPWKMDTEDTQDAFLTIKRMYERLLDVANTDNEAISMGESSATNGTKTETAPADPASESTPLLTTESDTLLLPPASSSVASPVSFTTSVTSSMSLTIAPQASPTTHPDVITSQSSPISSSLASPLTPASTISTCSKLSNEHGTPGPVSKPGPGTKRQIKRKADPKGAKPGAEQTCKAKRQTTKDCYICKKKIGVASKTCQHCSAKQPYKQKLEKRKKQFSQEWKDRQKKNSSVNKVYDATHLLLHKWQLLEKYPVLLLARRTSSGFSAECLCPWKMDTEDTQDAFLTIKRMYERLLDVASTDNEASSMGESSVTNGTKTETAPADPASESTPLLTTESDTLLLPAASSSVASPVSFTTSVTSSMSLTIAPQASPTTHPVVITSQSSPISSSLASPLTPASTLPTCSKLSNEHGTPGPVSSSQTKRQIKRKADPKGSDGHLVRRDRLASHFFRGHRLGGHLVRGHRLGGHLWTLVKDYHWALDSDWRFQCTLDNDCDGRRLDWRVLRVCSVPLLKFPQ